EWRTRSLEARKGVYGAIGISFDNNRDRSRVEPEAPAESEDQEEVGETSEAEGETRSFQDVPISANLPDHLADEIPPPPKWLRLELKLPPFEFDSDSAESDAHSAS